MQITRERPADTPYQFERRRLHRTPAVGSISVQTKTDDGIGRMHVLDLVDASVSGLGARANSPIPAGTPVIITFGDPRAFPRHGTIGRCVPTEDGYRLGISLERRFAA